MSWYLSLFMAEKYIVNLTQEEHSLLISLTSKGKTSSRIFKRANILLLADEGYPDRAIAETLHVGESTVHRTRQKFVEGGVEFALREEPRTGSKKKLVHYGINKAPVLATPLKGVAPLTERLLVFPITKKTGALFPPTSTRWERGSIFGGDSLQ